MKTYASEYSLEQSRFAGLVKTLGGAVVLGALVGCYVTAGPGNAYAHSVAQAATVQRVSLPRIEVVGSRLDAGQSVASISCSKGA